MGGTIRAALVGGVAWAPPSSSVGRTATAASEHLRTTTSASNVRLHAHVSLPFWECGTLRLPQRRFCPCACLRLTTKEHASTPPPHPCFLPSLSDGRLLLSFTTLHNFVVSDIVYYHTLCSGNVSFLNSRSFQRSLIYETVSHPHLHLHHGSQFWVASSVLCYSFLQ